MDKNNPKSFPVNTWWVFVQAEDSLGNKPHLLVNGKLPVPARPPQKLSDLVEEITVKAAYEDHNENTYKDALNRAAGGLDEGYSAWRKIMRAMDIAYTIRHDGLDYAPMPRVQFLHRRLLEIAYSDHMSGLTLEGLVEFFDDVCPCGEDHRADALRKLVKRIGLP